MCRNMLEVLIAYKCRAFSFQDPTVFMEESIKECCRLQSSEVEAITVGGWVRVGEIFCLGDDSMEGWSLARFPREEVDQAMRLSCHR